MKGGDNISCGRKLSVMRFAAERLSVLVAMLAATVVWAGGSGRKSTPGDGRHQCAQDTHGPNPGR